MAPQPCLHTHTSTHTHTHMHTHTHTLALAPLPCSGTPVRGDGRPRNPAAPHPLPPARGRDGGGGGGGGSRGGNRSGSGRLGGACCVAGAAGAGGIGGGGNHSSRSSSCSSSSAVSAGCGGGRSRRRRTARRRAARRLAPATAGRHAAGPRLAPSLHRHRSGRLCLGQGGGGPGRCRGAPPAQSALPRHPPPALGPRRASRPSLPLRRPARSQPQPAAPPAHRSAASQLTCGSALHELSSCIPV